MYEVSENLNIRVLKSEPDELRDGRKKRMNGGRLNPNCQSSYGEPKIDKINMMKDLQLWCYRKTRETLSDFWNVRQLDAGKLRVLEIKLSSMSKEK